MKTVNALFAVLLIGHSCCAGESPQSWWAFQPLRSVSAPRVRNTAWPRSEFDRFILAGLEAQGLSPAPIADKRTLLRRATFDLTGLPPTPEEIQAFLNDVSPSAFVTVVDRLLASPAYGERWGRHWLDVVRYADYFQRNPREHGSHDKFELHEAYRYRDWVVDAFNRDLPYDQFIVQQIAGDLVGGFDGIIATGFLSIGSWDNGDADKDKIVSDIVDDQIDVVSRAFLGLTISCARCHDHKFDPVSQEDYYGLAGIFYSTRTLASVGAKGDHTVIQRVPLASAEVLKKREAQLLQIQMVEKELRTAVAQRAAQLFASNAPGRAVIALHSDDLARQAKRLQELKAALLPAPPMALAVRESGTPDSMFPKIQDVPLHMRGSYTKLGVKVPRRMPKFLAKEEQPTIHGSGRLDLAKWIARPDHPLTARVMVNRVWQYHFGEGIVRTPSNFGKLGERPSHPELLDWLAGEFIRDGWSIKNLHRRIMLSATYQQSSGASKDATSQDPDNRWFGRFIPRRLEAEAIRDSMLAVSGRLDLARGGPATADVNLPRRSLYISTTRWDRANFSTLFDAANPDQPVDKRTSSTVAPQALFLLNNPFALAQAKHLAGRLRMMAGDDAARIRFAYELLYSRLPKPEELEIGREFVKTAGWDDYAHVLICANEFVHVD